MTKTETAEIRLLGDYRLLKQIGQGSLGAVYVAEHRFTKKQYAIKILPEELACDRSFVQRFEDEVDILSTLDHPNIVKMHNVSFSQGLYFLVSECVVDPMGESTNLWQYLQAHQRALSEDKIMQIASQIADALDFAHGLKDGNTRKIIHRSLKFNNVLIGVDQVVQKKTSSSLPHSFPRSPYVTGIAGSNELNSSFRVVLTDFGLSKIVGLGACLTRSFKAMAEALSIPQAAPQAKIGQDRYPFPAADTQKLIPLHQSFLQNFAFLAPEQKRLEVVSDEKADVYAFGILVYFLLMNEFPETSFALPSSRKSDFLYDWDLVVTECLKSNPSERPSCLEELLFRAAGCPTGACLPEVELSSQQGVESLQQDTARLAVSEELVSSEPEKIAIISDVVQQGNEKQKEKDLWDLFGVSKTEPILSTSDLAPSPVKKELTSWGTERIVKEYHPEKRETKNIQPLLTDMVAIQGDSYFRGSNHGCRDEMPRHLVKLTSFALDIHPVTNEQFVCYLDALGEEKDSQNNDIIRLRDSRIKKSAGRFLIEPGYAKHPVVGVTWYGACAYAKWIGKRLPTEAEWEVACCGGLENPMYPTGETIEKTQANFFSSDTTAVMSYPANEYGLFDMVGNVYEWCQDWYEYSFYESSAQEPDYPKGPLQGVYRVLRGGCWKSLKEDLRCSKRHRNNPGAANGTYGFRLAKDA